MDSPNKIWKRGVRTAKAAEYVIVEDLPDDLKECYVAVLVWLVHVDDSQIDERELCEIQLLMTQLRCGAEVRKAVRAHLEDPHSLAAHLLIDRIQAHEAAESTDTALALKCSLLKDAIRVCRATSEGPACEQSGIRRLAEMLKLDEEKVGSLRTLACRTRRSLRARCRTPRSRTRRKGWRHRPHRSAFRSPPST